MLNESISFLIKKITRNFHGVRTDLSLINNQI